MNLYGFVGNNPISFVDRYGLTWKKGSLGPPPSRITHPVGDWQATSWDYMTYNILLRQSSLFGALSTFAQELAQKYLNGSGGSYDASGKIPYMLRKEPSWKSELTMLLTLGGKFADSNTELDKPIKVYYDAPGGSGGWTLTGSTSNYVHYALGQFFYGLEGEVYMYCDSKGKNQIHFSYYTKIDDVYDFDNTTDSATPISNDSDWHRMQRVGFAQQFRVEGKKFGFEGWEQGSPPSSIEP